MKMSPEELAIFLEEGEGYKIEFKTEEKIRFDELINEKFSSRRILTKKKF